MVAYVICWKFTSGDDTNVVGIRTAIKHNLRESTVEVVTCLCEADERSSMLRACKASEHKKFIINSNTA